MTGPGLQERVARLVGRVEDFGDRFDGLDRRLEAFRDRVETQFAVQDQKMSKRFRWLVGGQVTLLVALVGTLATALFPG